MTTKTIHALIAETRENLKALERVAALMNGHLTAKVQATLPQRLEAAIQTRRKATGRPPTRETAQERTQRRKAIVTAALTGASRSVRELHSLLTDQGESISLSGVFHIVKSLPGLKKHGATTNRVYSLSVPVKASKAMSNGHGKLPAILSVLETRGPLKIKQLVAAVKDAGYDGPLTGIANYVKAGYLTRSKQGTYKFKARPEPEPTSQPADQSAN